MAKWEQKTDWVWCPVAEEWYAMFAHAHGYMAMSARKEQRGSAPRKFWRPLPVAEPITLPCKEDDGLYLVARHGKDLYTEHYRENGWMISSRTLSLESARALRDWLTVAIARMEGES